MADDELEALRGIFRADTTHNVSVPPPGADPLKQSVDKRIDSLLGSFQTLTNNFEELSKTVAGFDAEVLAATKSWATVSVSTMASGQGGAAADKISDGIDRANKVQKSLLSGGSKKVMRTHDTDTDKAIKAVFRKGARPKVGSATAGIDPDDLAKAIGKVLADALGDDHSGGGGGGGRGTGSAFPRDDGGLFHHRTAPWRFSEIDELIHRYDELSKRGRSLGATLTVIEGGWKMVKNTFGFLGTWTEEANRYRVAVREAAYEMDAVEGSAGAINGHMAGMFRFATKTQSAWESQAEITDIALSTNQSLTKVQGLYVKGLRSGYRTLVETRSVLRSSATTANALGVDAEVLSGYFNDIHVRLGLSSFALSAMGHSMRQIARDAKMSGETLVEAIRRSDVLVTNLKRSGSFTVSAADNVRRAIALAFKDGVDQQMGDILQALNSRQDFFAASNPIKHFIAMYGGSDAFAKAQQGTFMSDPQNMAKMAARMAGTFKSGTAHILPGGIDLDDMNRLTADQRNQADFLISQQSQGMLRLNDFEKLVKDFRESGKTVGERMVDRKRSMAGRSVAEIEKGQEDIRKDERLKSLNSLGDIMQRKKSDRSVRQELTMNSRGEKAETLRTTLQQMMDANIIAKGDLAGGAGLEKALTRVMLDSGMKAADIESGFAGDDEKMMEMIRNLDAARGKEITVEKAKADPMSDAAAAVLRMETTLKGIYGGVLSIAAAILGGKVLAGIGVMGILHKQFGGFTRELFATTKLKGFLGNLFGAKGGVPGSGPAAAWPTNMGGGGGAAVAGGGSRIGQAARGFGQGVKALKPIQSLKNAVGGAVEGLKYIPKIRGLKSFGKVLGKLAPALAMVEGGFSAFSTKNWEATSGKDKLSASEMGTAAGANFVTTTLGALTVGLIDGVKNLGVMVAEAVGIQMPEWFKKFSLVDTFGLGPGGIFTRAVAAVLTPFGMAAEAIGTLAGKVEQTIGLWTRVNGEFGRGKELDVKVKDVQARQAKAGVLLAHNDAKNPLRDQWAAMAKKNAETSAGIGRLGGFHAGQDEEFGVQAQATLGAVLAQKGRFEGGDDEWTRTIDTIQAARARGMNLDPATEKLLGQLRKKNEVDLLKAGVRDEMTRKGVSIGKDGVTKDSFERAVETEAERRYLPPAVVTTEGAGVGALVTAKPLNDVHGQVENRKVEGDGQKRDGDLGRLAAVNVDQYEVLTEIRDLMQRIAEGGREVPGTLVAANTRSQIKPRNSPKYYSNPYGKYGHGANKAQTVIAT